VSSDVPIFAHCSYGEFQAAKGYGERNPNPKFWLELLEKHDELRTLRLCLGHAGGSDYWFTNTLSCHPDWGEAVVKLCTTYPNVYCEVGILEEVAD